MKDHTSSIFEALAHPTRRQILQDLKDGELTAGEIAAKFQTTAPTISRHLRVLREADLVSERREANRIYYSLISGNLALSVGDFLSSVCPEQIVLREVRKRRVRPPETTDTSARTLVQTAGEATAEVASESATA